MSFLVRVLFLCFFFLPEPEPVMVLVFFWVCMSDATPWLWRLGSVRPRELLVERLGNCWTKLYCLDAVMWLFMLRLPVLFKL